MAETDVMSVLQNVHSAKTKFFFIIGTRDTWVRPENLKNIFSNHASQLHNKQKLSPKTIKIT